MHCDTTPDRLARSARYCILPLDQKSSGSCVTIMQLLNQNGHGGERCLHERRVFRIFLRVARVENADKSGCQLFRVYCERNQHQRPRRNLTNGHGNLPATSTTSSKLNANTDPQNAIVIVSRGYGAHQQARKHGIQFNPHLIRRDSETERAHLSVV